MGRSSAYRFLKSSRSSIRASVYLAASLIMPGEPSGSSHSLLNRTSVRSLSSTLNTCRLYVSALAAICSLLSGGRVVLRPVGCPVVDLHHRALQDRLARRDLEWAMARREETLDGGFLAQADDAVPRTAHPHVGLVRGPGAQHALVGGLHVRVRPQHRGHAAVEEVAHRVLLAGRLAVHVDQDARGLLAQLRDQPLRCAEGAVEGLHEDPALQVHHPKLAPAARGDHRVAPTGRAVRVVGRAELPRTGPIEIRQDLALAPSMVAAGEQVQPRLEQLVRAFRRDPGAARRILRVAHAQVEAVPLAKDGHEVAHRRPARLAYDVPQEQDLQGALLARTSRASVQTASTRRSCSPTGTSGTS